MAKRWVDDPEMVDTLRRLVKEGVSATQAAVILSRQAGTPISRNAVIGYIRRAVAKGDDELVLARSNGPTGPRANTAARRFRPKPTIPTPPEPRIREIAMPLAAASPVLPAPPPRLPAVRPPAARNVPLLETHARGCRWPTGWDDKTSRHLFCNAPQDDRYRSPYCTAHQRGITSDRTPGGAPNPVARMVRV